ncbi:MAG: TadE/TadG family type IV pilus assembly protein [Pelobacteraceae bacterium]
MPTRKAKNIRGYERGQALVEFALILPFLLLLLFGVIEFGRALFQKNMTVNAARSGARAGAVSPAASYTSNINDAVYAVFAQTTLGSSIVTAPQTAPNSGSGVPVTVTVTTKFKTVVPKLLIPLENYTSITASATMRYEQ